MTNPYSLLRPYLSGHEITEGLISLRIYNVNITEQIYQDLCAVGRQLNTGEGWSLTVNNNTFSDTPVNLDGAYSSYYEGSSKLLLSKPSTGDKYFVTEQGLEGFLNNKESEFGTGNIKFYFDGKSFESLTTSVYHFEDAPKKIIGHDKPVNAIKYVRPLDKAYFDLAPMNVLSWIVSDNVTSRVDLPKSWKRQATKRLIVSMCSEFVSANDNAIELIFRGDRRKTVSIGGPIFEDLSYYYGIINEAAYWIFADSKDIDTRHTIFNSQLAYLIPEKRDLCDGKDGEFAQTLSWALDNSKVAYRYHLQASSKELVKSLTDLNKALFDYIGKIRQNTTDLVNGMWKDFTTVFALLILNYSVKKPDLPEGFYKCLGIGIIVYLIVSFGFVSRMGFWFFSSLKKNMVDWRSKLYSYLTNDDWNNYAISPLETAQGRYRNAFFVVMALYVAMAFTVCYFLL